jgi:hypothetical protein
MLTICLGWKSRHVPSKASQSTNETPDLSCAIGLELQHHSGLGIVRLQREERARSFGRRRSILVAGSIFVLPLAR